MWTSHKDLAYCAGLYEGEGTICFSKQSHPLKSGGTGRSFRSIRLTIQMTNKEPLELFQEMLDIGTVTGPTPPRSSQRKATYQYRVSGFKDVQYIISSIWHLLSSTRKNQAEIAMKQYLDWELVNVKRG